MGMILVTVPRLLPEIIVIIRVVLAALAMDILVEQIGNVGPGIES